MYNWLLVLLLVFNLNVSDADGNVLEEIGNEPVDVVESGLSDEEIMQIKPNELGKVMVFMYHNLVEEEAREGYYARTPDNFRKDLERLYQEGYVPISMSDLVNGHIDIPAGKTPVVFTFDDGSETNFKILEDGSIDPNCVIGIFEEFQSKYPDFVPKATFYLNHERFFGNGEHQQRKLDYLIEHGYELANHTSTHGKLTELTAEQGKQIIVEQAAYLELLTGQTSFHFSVPFGKKPEDYATWPNDANAFDGYTMLSSVNVGWNPIVSPFDNAFDRFSINRITCGEDEAEMHYWLDNLKNYPEQRYISDGNAQTIVFPKEQMAKLNPELAQNYTIKTYDESGVQ